MQKDQTTSRVVLSGLSSAYFTGVRHTFCINNKMIYALKGLVAVDINDRRP